MHRRIPMAAAVTAAALCTPLAALAAPVYHVPPTIIHRGTNSSPIVGKGVVVVQVFVNKDGSFKVIKVLRSSNPGDNAAALQIARSSTYRPASRGSQKLTEYYDYTLRFTSGGAAGNAGSNTGGGGTGGNGTAGGGAGRFEMMMRAGNYSGAQSGLRSYVAEHPSDTSAQAQLGVVDTYLSDYAGAVAAFDKAGSIPTGLKGAASKAYSENAATLSKNSQHDAAIASAKRAVALSPNFYSYTNLGAIESAAGRNDAAAVDLEKAGTLEASASHLTTQSRLQFAENQEAAFLANKNVDKAKVAAAQIAQLDPSSAAAANIWANAYLQPASELVNSGKQSDAAALLEQGAASAPQAAAVQLYARAAFDYLNAQPKPDNDKAKADADKALALAPGDAQANFAEGVVLANSGKNADALTYLNKADDAAKKAGNTDLAASIERIIKQVPAK